VLPCLSNAAVQQCSHVFKVAALSAAMFQRYSSATTSPKWLHSMLPCLNVAAMQPHFQSTAVQPCFDNAATSRQCSHISASQDRMVQGYKRRWSGGQPSSRPTPVDGSIELLVLQYCPILSCLVLYFPAWL